MIGQRDKIPELFRSRFQVDEAAPFRRYLNRLEVEIGREDYRHLKRVELVDEELDEEAFASMEELTERLLATTQNNYNRDLLRRLEIKVYLDPARYRVYYRLPGRVLRFVPVWRQRVLRAFFRSEPVADSGWQSAGSRLPGFAARFLPDPAGGVLLLRRDPPGEDEPLLTATHGPYDPHTLEVTLYLLRTGRGGKALVNLGFSGREPLADENLARLRELGVPLNPSNIDVIYPYTDARGHPYCYKLEEGLERLAPMLGETPSLVIDLHGCVGTGADDRRLVVGLGGLPPWIEPPELGQATERGARLQVCPTPLLARGLELVKALSPQVRVQLCSSPHRCYNLALDRGGGLVGRCLDPRQDVASLLPGEERTFLKRENLRWLPGAGGNALQRRAVRRLRPDALCLHVEIPTAVRRQMTLRLRQLEIAESLDSSGL